MGGFCGAISNRDVVLDVYFGTDYHSHLGTRRGGMAGLDRRLTQELGVPVVEGVAAAVRLAESLHALGLATSKVRTYAPPRPKAMQGWPLARA